MNHEPTDFFISCSDCLYSDCLYKLFVFRLFYTCKYIIFVKRMIFYQKLFWRTCFCIKFISLVNYMPILCMMNTPVRTVRIDLWYTLVVYRFCEHAHRHGTDVDVNLFTPVNVLWPERRDELTWGLHILRTIIRRSGKWLCYIYIYFIIYNICYIFILLYVWYITWRYCTI